MTPAALKPSHKAIQAYHAKIREYDAGGVGHESGRSPAFHNLLDETARAHGWALVDQLSLKVRGKTIRPDGTLRDAEWLFPRGYWEAKDSDDDLDAEIRKKVARGYPLVNTIFEDTRTGVLFQNGTEVVRADLRKPEAVADFLTRFYGHTERDTEGFEQAVTEFKDRVPHLAEAIARKIEAAHEAVPRFQTAFEGLMELCRSALNPNIRVAAVDEMLVQHLLTERLFRTVFDNADFVKRNVIAAEIETVIVALTSQSFNRAEFLRALDPFYKAIEEKARTIDDFAQKQHFLNTVYERFFQGYSVKTADTHGIVYTPQPIVDFMCASVQEVLKTEFGRDLGSEGVHILDPCTGTGNFVVNLLRRIGPRDLKRAYTEGLFANEVMLLPYYIAAQNIEHEYYDLTGQYEPFEGLCFVDTLELAEAEQATLSFMTEENTARVAREKKAPINVIIGNPPYNVGQLNENDNNKNRKYEIVDKRVRETYARGSAASSVSKLYDPYVKFFRWAIDRLDGHDGIICFVSNNSFVDQIAFDGMRKHLLQDFTRIYHLDLQGNVRRNPKLSGTSYNVFGIQVGVGVTVAIRSSKHEGRDVFHCQVPEDWRKGKKLEWVSDRRAISGVEWKRLSPDDRHTWLVSDNAEEYGGYIPIGSREAKEAVDPKVETLFKSYSFGIVTARDEIVYDFNHKELANRIEKLVEDYNAEVDRYRRSGTDKSLDDFVQYSDIKWSRDLKQDVQRQHYAEFRDTKIRLALYRPFCQLYLFYDRILNEETRLFQCYFPTQVAEDENRVIIIKVGQEYPNFSIVSNRIVDMSFQAGCQSFPFYVYDEDGTNRRENITDWSVALFREHYGDPMLTKWDIFHYVYGVLHQPAYRSKFADNLKRELPRIPLRSDFRAFADAGRRLAELHIGYESVERWPLEWEQAEGAKVSYRVEAMKLTKDKSALVVNETLTLAGIPPEVFAYRLGNRSALEWVIDQYRVTTDKRSGIVSDPNRKDDPEFIVHLVERVVRVSVETAAIVASLPDEA